MDNNPVKRTLHCERRIIIDCVLNNTLSLIVYSFIRERIFITHFVSPLLVRVPYFSLYIHSRRESCVYMMLARVPVHFIHDMVYYLRRAASHDGRRASMFRALRFCLRSRGFQRRVLFQTHAWARNPRHLHRDAMRRWHPADVVADRAGFVDNEPSFMNGSPVTKPGRLRPC